MSAILAGNQSEGVHLYFVPARDRSCYRDFCPEGIEAETEQVLRNIHEILAAADSDFSKVVKATVFSDRYRTFFYGKRDV